MNDILKEFGEEGLIRERVVTGGHDNASGDLPKVNPDAPQSHNTVADIKQNDVDKAGDQNKDDDPTDPADQGNLDDKMMNSVVKSMESAEAALEHMCEECQNGKGKDYHEDKKRNLKEYLESVKMLRAGVYEMANMESY